MTVKKRNSLTEFEIKIAEKLEKMILKKYKSYRQFCRATGFHTQTLNDIVNFKQHINMKHLEKILSGLDNNYISIFADGSLPSLSQAEMKQFIEIIDAALLSPVLRAIFIGEFYKQGFQFKSELAQKKISSAGMQT